MASVIKAESISKQYRLGEIGTGSLSHDINRFWHKIKGKEDPYLKIGEANDRASKGESDYVWSLRDVSFDIEQGDAVGIIGRNGAGKSTLLKILSRVTAPTTGSIKVKGRIASLLEVGTGFHPDLSGRDNIFLNGAILGMRKHEIKRKFDEIVDFAGVERYIDTPVKRYSSGMYVRLAFAVAAHLESEILIVDEVLAVGDAEFQKKCLGKMGDVSKGEGRTVLFVSHNMAAVSQLCSKGLMLQNGQVRIHDNIINVIETYAKKDKIENLAQASYKSLLKISNSQLTVIKVYINESEQGKIKLDEDVNYIKILFEFECHEECFVAIEGRIHDELGIVLASYSEAQFNGVVEKYNPGIHIIEKVIHLPDGIVKGDYMFSLYLNNPGYHSYVGIEDLILEHTGFPSKTGTVFNYSEKHGWIFLS